jgi:hypothetical protein
VYTVHEVVLQESRFLDGVIGMFCFEGPCTPYIPCNSREVFRHTEQIEHHSAFHSVGTGLSGVYRHTLRILD